MFCTANTNILSTDQEMMPAMNATDAQAQDFMVKDEFLLFILSAFADCTPLKMLDVFHLCTWNTSTVCRSYQ